MDFPVKEHNADGVDGNTYIWNIRKDKEDNSIFLQSGSNGSIIDNSDGQLGNNNNGGSIATSEGKKSSNNNAVILVIIGLASFVVVLFSAIKLKKDR